MKAIHSKEKSSSKKREKKTVGLFLHAVATCTYIHTYTWLFNIIISKNITFIFRHTNEEIGLHIDS